MSGPGAGGPSTSSAILADLLVLADSNASTWERLPPAADVEVEDDLSLERGWFVAVPGVGAAAIPDAIRDLALVTTDEGFVSKPITLAAMVGRLGLMEKPVSVYPILANA